MNFADKLKEAGFLVEQTDNQYKKIRGKGIFFVRINSQLIPMTQSAVTLAKAGISTTGYGFYASYYSLSDDEASILRYGCSARSREYIEATMKNIGLERITDVANCGGGADGELTTCKNIATYNFFMNVETTLGLLEDGTYVTQTCFQYIVDDFAVVKMYFSRKPSERDMEVAFVIRDVESYFSRPNFNGDDRETFVCYGCGNPVHWLNIPGGIKEKWSNLQERYCGC